LFHTEFCKLDISKLDFWDWSISKNHNDHISTLQYGMELSDFLDL
jgi:hypothetical protein